MVGLRPGGRQDLSVFSDLLSGVAVANGINSTLLSQSKDADDWFI